MQNQVNQNQFLEQIFDSLQNGVVIFDKDLRIIKTNKWLLDKLEPHKELSNLHRYKYINTPNSLSPDFPVLKAFKTAKSFKEMIQDPFGEGLNKFYEVSTYPMYNEIGDVNYVIENYMSVSDLEYDEKILHSTNKEHLASNEDLEKKTIANLEENEERFRRLFQTIPDAVMVTGSDCTLTDINDNFTKLFGYTKEEVIGTISIEDIIWCKPEDQKEILDILDEKGSLSNKEVCFRRKSGKIITTLFSASRIVLNKKAFTISIIRDISTLKLERYSLQKAQEIGKIGTWNIDVKDSSIFWTEETYKIFGIEPGTQINYDIFMSQVHPEDIELVDRLWKKALKGEHFNSEHRLLINGKVKWVREITDFRNKHVNKAESVIGITEDITHLKQSERTLKHALKKMEAIFLANPTAIGLVQNRKFKELNKNIFYLTGYEADELLEKSSRIIYPSDEEFNYVGKEKYKQIEENGVGTLETSFLKKDGSLVDVLVSSAPLDPNDISKGTIFTALDISERKNTEMQLKDNVLLLERKNEEIATTNEELKQAIEAAEEANRLKTEFLNNMSHEIRTPMNGIMGFSGMLGNLELNNNKRDNYINIIQNSSNQLLKIIDDILDISVLETKHEKIDETALCLNDLFIELFSRFNLKSKERNVPIYLKRELSDKQSYIITDRAKLSKILSHLLENALKYTNEGYIELGYQIEQSILKIYVKDTGLGIAKENQEIIFDRFSQSGKEIHSKQSGLGLGLSISKENAQLLGGDINLDSQKGEGSTFYVNIPYVPVNKESVDAAINILDSRKEEETTYTILVAEDEEINYLYIEALLIDLTDKNYKLLHAINGKEAVDICMENNDIDLVLMDIKMPIMGGYEAIELIKSELPDLPIIAQTAYSSKSDKKQAIEHGCSGFISKPINKDDLLSLIEKHLVK